MLNFLTEKDGETSYLDFKEIINVEKSGAFAKIAKDIFAFSNYGGGFILVGFREAFRAPNSSEIDSGQRRHFEPVGLPHEFHVDQAEIQSKFNAYVRSPLEIRYREYFRDIDGQSRRFGAIYIPPSTEVLKPVVDGVYSDRGKVRLAFSVDTVLIRRGTQSIVASEEERQWIQGRSEATGYKVSVLSGEPDQIQETLHGNMVEVVRLPELIWTGRLAKERRIDRLVTAQWYDFSATLADLSNPSNTDLGSFEPGSVQGESLQSWLSDRNKRIIVMQLLNDEVRALAKSIGLIEEPEKTKFYYPCDGDSRTEVWVTRQGRSSNPTVAQRIWAEQLKRFVYWHLAINLKFVSLGNRLFLRISPTIQLTADGKRAIFGEREGTVITRLTYNKYNSSYINSLLFWISKISEGRSIIELARGAVTLSANPVSSKISVGIVFDRPFSEPVQESESSAMTELA